MGFFLLVVLGSQFKISLKSSAPMKPLNVVKPESGKGFRTTVEVLKEKGKSVIIMDVDEIDVNDSSGA